jgi:ribosomal protein L20
VRAVVTQELARAAIERHRKVLAQIAVGHDIAALVAKEQRHDRKTVCVLTEPRRLHDAVP